MRNQPPPLYWPPVVPLEMARRQREQAHRALDLAFQRHAQRQASPEVVTAAFHAAARADAYEAALLSDAPSFDALYPRTRRNAQ